MMFFILYDFIWISDATKDADALFQKQMLATRLRHKDNILSLCLSRVANICSL